MPKKKERGLGDAVQDPSAFVKAGPGKDRDKGGPPTKDLKMVNTRLPMELYKEMKVYCAVNDITMQNFITGAVADRLKK